MSIVAIFSFLIRLFCQVGPLSLSLVKSNFWKFLFKQFYIFLFISNPIFRFKAEVLRIFRNSALELLMDFEPHYLIISLKYLKFGIKTQGQILMPNNVEMSLLGIFDWLPSSWSVPGLGSKSHFLIFLVVFKAD